MIKYIKYFAEINPLYQRLAFGLLVLLCAMNVVSPPIALLMGFVFGELIGNPIEHINHKMVSWLLKISVISLGFGMNIQSAVSAGKQGISFTIVSIIFTIGLSFVFSRVLKMNRKTSFLVASGTAICGGSAIAAIAPIINASEKEISVSLGIVFLLNAVALFVFPPIGHAIGLSQHQFGIWAAIAIHDTSSVVGAAGAYGADALQTATVVKLARALWIIPLSVITALVLKKGKKKINIPWFILLFIIAILLNTYLPFIHQQSGIITNISKRALIVSLFLIGSGLSVKQMKSVGWKPFASGIMLWLLVSISSLIMLRYNVQ